MAQQATNAPRDWYRITCQADAAVAEIWIYDLIGEFFDWWTGETTGISAKTFLDEMQALPATVKTIRVHLNSPGGNWSDSVAIANMLRDQSRDKGRTVEILIEALAASGATIVSSAGDTIKMASNAMMMVHEPAGDAYQAKSKDMRQMADALDSMRDSMVATYRWVSKLSAEAIQALMEATTWMNAEQALANGFITEIIEPVAATVSFNPRSIKALGEIPEPYRERVAALVQKPDTPQTKATEPAKPQPAEATAVLSACEAAGCLDIARSLIESAATMEQVTARVQTEQSARAARAQREKEIRALCAAAKQPELADGYVAGGMPVEQVKAQLTIITAKQDKIEIDASLPPDAGGAAKTTRLNPSAIRADYARIGQRGA